MARYKEGDYHICIKIFHLSASKLRDILLAIHVSRYMAYMYQGIFSVKYFWWSGMIKGLISDDDRITLTIGNTNVKVKTNIDGFCNKSA